MHLQTTALPLLCVANACCALANACYVLQTHVTQLQMPVMYRKCAQRNCERPLCATHICYAIANAHYPLCAINACYLIANARYIAQTPVIHLQTPVMYYKRPLRN